MRKGKFRVKPYRLPEVNNRLLNLTLSNESDPKMVV